jgi:hypothetical protein
MLLKPALDLSRGQTHFGIGFELGQRRWNVNTIKLRHCLSPCSRWGTSDRQWRSSGSFKITLHFSAVIQPAQSTNWPVLNRGKQNASGEGWRSACIPN